MPHGIRNALLVLTLLAMRGYPFSGETSPGVVVVTIRKNLTGEKAGLQEGDLILGWRQGAAQGTIESPFDLSTLEIEKAPRGPVLLEGLRGTEKLSWTLRPGKWGIGIRPQMSDSVLSTYREGREFVNAGKLAEAAEKWRNAADQARDACALWFRYHIARMLADARRWDEADKAYQLAIDAATDAGPVVRTQLFSSWGDTYRNRSDWNNAEACYQRSVAEAQKLSKESLSLAKGHYHLGQIYYQRGDLEKAEKYYAKALEIREAVTPGSLDFAASLNSVGDTAYGRGDLAKAEEYYRQALEIRRKLAAGTLDVAASLVNLGGVAFSRRDLAKAEEYFRQALDIHQKLAPRRLEVAKDLGHLGNVAEDQGKLAQAEAYQRQALEIRQKLVPGSLAVASSFKNLGNVAWERGDLANAEEYHRQALEIRQKLAPGSLDVAASLGNLGGVAFSRGDLAKAEEYFRQALDIHQKLAPRRLDVAKDLGHLGNVAYDQGKLAQAEAYQRQALEIRQKLAPGSLAVASSFHSLGLLAWQRGDFAKAEEHHRQALEIRRKLAPGSLDVAASLVNLGGVAFSRGDLAKAEEYHRQALEIRQKLAPESLDVAASLANLGKVAYDRGELAQAEAYQRQALEIRQKLAPGSLAVASSFKNLGTVAWERGDLAKAEEYHRQALEIRQKLAPGSLDEARSLRNLGIVAFSRGDLAKAEEYFRQALDIYNKLAPGSPDAAQALDNLGAMASEQGDLAKAEALHNQALALLQMLAPTGTSVARTLNSLGEVAAQRRDFTKAEKYYRQSLAIQRQLAEEDMTTGYTYSHLADISRDRGDLAGAAEYYDRALSIVGKLAPGSTAHAAYLASLAAVMGRKGELDSSAQLYEQALNAFESQTARLGGAEETHSNFRASHLSYFADYIDLLMREKKHDLAFYVAERWRARSLLETLAMARVDIRQGVQPSLRESERSLEESLRAKSDRRITLLTAQPVDEKQVAEVEREIGDLRSQYDDLLGRIRTTSPVYAALTQPQPLNAAQVQLLLDDDTLLLEYALGAEHSYVWAVTRSSLAGYQLPPRSEVENLARRLYELVSAPDSRSTIQGKTAAGTQARWNNIAARLSRMLLGPVAADLPGKNLLIVGDGALQYVPFAVLPVPGKATGTPLIVEHEIVYAPSASVVAELRRQASGRSLAPKAVAVLADPVFDKEDPRVLAKGGESNHRSTTSAGEIPVLPNGRLTRSAADVGLARLPRLAFSHREADAIMAVTPPGQGKEALGFEANRETATSPELAQYRIVHFATHALSDSRHPELSGLVLSLVDRKGRPQDGFLDLQGIYNLNFSAELVVLSACQTALGKEVAGEGLIGLTRGFMYAGATRVVASLWNADDVATKELMERFYRAMERAGMRPAAALRQAQMELRKQPRWREPYYWGAFQLQGEWR